MARFSEVGGSSIWDDILANESHTPNITDDLAILMNNKSYSIYDAASYIVNVATSDWAIYGNNAAFDGVSISGDDAQKYLKLYAGHTAGLNSQIFLYPDSMVFRPGLSKINIDSLRSVTDTLKNKPMVWNTDNGMWSYLTYWPVGTGVGGGVDSVTLENDTLFYYTGATPTVITPVARYNLTGLSNWDLPRYNASGREWVNYKSTYIDNTDPAIKMLVRDTITGQQYHTDIPTGGGATDSLLYINFQTGLTENGPVGGDNYIVFPEIGDNDINDMWVYRDGQFQHISSLYGITKSGDTLYFAPNLSDSERVTVRIIKDRPNRELTFAAPGFSYLLDDYPSAEAAYSLRKLRSAYSGSAIRVMRSNDLVEQDIGFVDNVLDTTSLLSFIGANSGEIVKWYDQSGNGNDLTTSGGNFARIVFSGVLRYTNGKPSIDFGTDGVARYVWFPNGLFNGTTTLSYFHVAEITDFGSSNAGVVAPSNASGVGFEILQHSVISRRTLLRFNGTARNDNAGAGYQLWDDATQSLTSIFGNSTDVAAYKNSSAVTLTDASAMPALNFNGTYAVGQYVSAGFFMKGTFSELIIYTSNQASNRAGIETNINSFYAIY